MNLGKLLLFLTIIFLNTFVSFATTVKGVVRDSEKRPMPGTSVVEKGKKNGTITDFNGRFSLKVNSSKSVLVFSFVGFISKEVKLGNKKGAKIIVELVPDSGRLEEIIVVNYRPKKREAAFSSDMRVHGSRPTERGRIRIRGISSVSPAIDPSSMPRKAPAITITNNEQVTAGTLTAGEVNDFSKWILWNDKSQEELREHQQTWKISPQTRFSVMLQNNDGNPIIDHEVVLFDKKQDTVWVAKTDNTGKAELWANMFEKEYKKTDHLLVNVNYGKKDYSIRRAKTFNEGVNLITINKPCEVSNTVEVAFVVDATSSMTDEITYLKAELSNVIDSVKKSDSDIELNVGCIFYRDSADAYLTRRSDLSPEIDQTINFIKSEQSGGGGDFPEAMDDALLEATEELDWSEKARTKIIFLVLDAPPHEETKNIAKIRKASLLAAAKGIKIVPVTGSGIDKKTEYLMRSLALATNGTYTFLTDDSGVGSPHIKPTTDTYEVEKLNALMVRLFRQFTTVVSCKEKDLLVQNEQFTDTTNIQGNLKPGEGKKRGEDKQDKEENKENNDEDKEKELKPFKCKFYPNPTSGILNIDIEGEVTELFLTDISGKILQRYPLDGKTFLQIDISHFPKGIFFITYFGPNDRPVSGKVLLFK